jgi:D-cysteine desulfhydrase
VIDLDLPVRVPLARLPTPFEPLVRTGDALGLPLWIKRDDLTGVALTGNKVRKLEFLAAMALQQGADTLVTCGAIGSNHARATAVVAARLGLRSHLVLRGADQVPPAGNLLLVRLLGAGTRFITGEEWRERETILAEEARRLASDHGRRPYVIPEGGSNALGSLGYAVAVFELLEQARAQAVRVGRIVHATGSAGTTAGLALGVAAAGRDDLEVVGVAVCDDRAYFDAKIARLVEDATRAGWVPEPVRRRTRWTIVDGYQGEGYARTTPPEMADLAAFARREGVILDPVYTGKAFSGLVGEHRAGRLGCDGATVFLHTGGIFGLFAHAADVAALG